jgi:hypothetical protein
MLSDDQFSSATSLKKERWELPHNKKGKLMIENLARPNTAVIYHARNWGITGPGAGKSGAIRAHSGSM